MDKITVIMPCYILNEETLQITKNAIESLGDVYIIIVDNASTIGGGYLRSVADIYIRNSRNLGYARAVNQGKVLSETPLTAIANNDIRVSPNWQEVAQEVFDTDKDIYSLHFRMTDYDVPFAYGAKIALTGKERWCTGSFFVVDTFKELYFDEDLLNSYDDWDFQMRARENGWYTAYTDMACYQHLHSHTQKQIPEREENNRKNAEVFKEKWGKYAEELFTSQFPEQMAEDYWKGFNI